MKLNSGLIERAKNFLGIGTKTAKPTATDAVIHDAFDAAIYDSVLGEAGILQTTREALVDAGAEYADDLLRDVFMQFFQEQPDLRDAEEMAETHQLNRAVAESIADAVETRETRTHTPWDQYSSVLAATAALAGAEDVIRQHAEQLKDAEQRKAEAEEAMQKSLERLMQAKEKADQAEQDGDEEAAQSAAEQAAQAEQELEESTGAAEQATQQAAAATMAVAAGVRRQVGQAIQQVNEQLDDEADMMGAFGISEDDAKKMSFRERARLAERLRNTRLAKFRKLVGRFRRLSSAARSKKVEHGMDEIVGVELSGDLSRVLASEIVLSEAHEVFELDFLHRLSEDRLLSRQYVGVEQVGDGAIICCVDNSGSMHSPGDREAWAKAFALALYDQARSAGRDFVWINFSSHNEQTAYHFPNGRGSVEDLIQAVEHFYGNYTDFDEPLRMAVEVIERDFNAGKKKADIVFITDGTEQCSPYFLERFRQAKDEIGFRVFGIGVDVEAGGLEDFADTIYHVADLADTSAGEDIMKAL